MTSLTLSDRKTWLAGLTRTPERAVVVLIAGFAICRLIIAAMLGLGVDECYGIGVSHDLGLSYFDHPPLSYWIAHVFMPLFGDGRALRIPFVALFAGTMLMTVGGVSTVKLNTKSTPSCTPAAS